MSDLLKVAKLVNGRMGIQPRSFCLHCDFIELLDHQHDVNELRGGFSFKHPVQNVMLLDTSSLQVTELQLRQIEGPARPVPSLYNLIVQLNALA